MVPHCSKKSTCDLRRICGISETAEFRGTPKHDNTQAAHSTHSDQNNLSGIRMLSPGDTGISVSSKRMISPAALADRTYTLLSSARYV
jgi:hypothetical protein